MSERMWILGIDGPEVVEATASERSLIGGYWNAVQRFLGTGETSTLDPFEGAEVGGFELETDPDAIEEWWRRRELDFLDIYES